MDQSARLSAADLLDRAGALTPLLSDQAEANEAGGRLTEPVVEAFVDGGFLGLMLPRAVGGAEATPIEALKVLEQLCYADGSSGWVFMATQVAMASAAAYLPSATATTLFGERFPIIEGHGAPVGRAEVVPDGYRLSGDWSYGSGVLHAEYLHSGAMVYEKGERRTMPGFDLPEHRIFITPASAAEIDSEWNTLGLRATGSVDYRMRDVFVPEEFTHLATETKPQQGGNFYRMSIIGMGTICHSAFALGVARRALDEMVSLATAETGRPTALRAFGGSESMRERYGAAEAKLRAARAFVMEAWAEYGEALDRDEDLPVRVGTLVRLALNHVTTVAAEVCELAYLAGGGRSLRGGIIQRCFRDIYSATQHITVQPAVLQHCASELIGAAEGKRWIFTELHAPK